jgi:hypothetical protein
VQVGDASGIQSPISFGGFGAITRHISRLSNGIISLSFSLWRKGHCKVDVPNSVTNLKWTRIYEWCVGWCGSKNGHEKRHAFECRCDCVLKI